MLKSQFYRSYFLVKLIKHKYPSDLNSWNWGETVSEAKIEAKISKFKF